MTRDHDYVLWRSAMPYHMVWLATNECNLRCLHCSSDSGHASSGELQTREVFDLIDQLADCGVIDLGISGGEPFLRPDLFDIVTYARQKGFTVGVGSNGTSLSDEKIRKFAESGITRLQVSLDGFSETHDRLRARRGVFRLAVDGIRRAINAGIRTNACFTVNRLNVGELEQFCLFAADLGIRRLNISRYVPTGRNHGYGLDLNPSEWGAVIASCLELRCRLRGRLDVVTHLSQRILAEPELAKIPGFSGCQAGLGQGCVTATGDVWPCVLLPVPLGNVRRVPFREIWQTSTVIRNLQNRANLKGACGACEVREKCGGCRAVALARTGDYLAADPRSLVCGAPQNMLKTVCTQRRAL